MTHNVSKKQTNTYLWQIVQLFKDWDIPDPVGSGVEWFDIRNSEIKIIKKKVKTWMKFEIFNSKKKSHVKCLNKFGQFFCHRFIKKFHAKTPAKKNYHIKKKKWLTILSK